MKNSKIPKELRKTDKKFAYKGGKRKVALAKVLVANVMNLLLLAATFYLLGRLPVVAKQMKELHSAQIAAEETTDAGVLNAEIERNKEKVDIVTKFYAGDQEFLDLVDAVYDLRDEGVFSEVVFPGGGSVTVKELAKIGAKGFPVGVTIRGSEEAINSGLSRIFSLPFLFYPQDVELVLEPGENSGELVMKFNFYLVVNENFAAN